MSIKHWFVSPLLSPDEEDNLIDRLLEVFPHLPISQLKTEICYNVATDEELSNSETETLKWLLSEDESRLPEETSTLSSASPDRGLIIEVGPRLTFTSPFSTNAVSIAHSAGLRAVQRIEQSRRYEFTFKDTLDGSRRSVTADISAHLHDPMTEMLYLEPLPSFQPDCKPQDEVFQVDVMTQGRAALERLNSQLGLAMDDFDLDLYTDLFRSRLGRNPTNVECFDLSQSNSEHSRHWFFRGRHVIDGQPMPMSLFQLVQSTQETTNRNNSIAFSDNSSAIEGLMCTPVILPSDPTCASLFVPVEEPRDICFTAETHNFPTGVAPFPGATTGTGGRIRDVQSTGRGAHVVAGTAGYSVGNLHLKDYDLPWEKESVSWTYPANLASPQEILIRASDGASDYGNKFGEPVLAGFARSFGAIVSNERIEWLKPIMFSGGLGQLPSVGRAKKRPEAGMLVAKIGGPVYRIGVGGGAASSVQVHGDNAAERDFNAVQRGDAEMEQKMNRVVRGCIEARRTNPIMSIHDQGAGGNGNVLKEIAEPAGAMIEAAAFALGDPTLSSLEVWGAEYQESNAVLLGKGVKDRRLVEAIARREKCPMEVVGEITGDGRIRMKARDGSVPVDLELDMVLGKMPQKTFTSTRKTLDTSPLKFPFDLTVKSAFDLVLRLPSVASKRYLTNKVDRSVTGLVARQQCVGPLHTPLADVAVVALSYWTKEGAATAIGEQPIKLLLDPARGARLSVAEALTNLVFAPVSCLEDVKCSCNWMWPAKLPHEAAALYDACVALTAVLRELGVGIDGGKDSLSMAARVKEENGENVVVKSPRCLVVSTYARCPDITKVLTPALVGDAALLLVRFLSPSACPPHRLGASALATCLSQLGGSCPDLDQPAALSRAFHTVQAALNDSLLLSGHDVSDGGLGVALLEMAFAGQRGIDVDLSLPGEPLSILFAEEPALVLEVKDECLELVLERFKAAEVWAVGVGRSLGDWRRDVTLRVRGTTVWAAEDVGEAMEAWEETSRRLDALQCRRECVEEEAATLGDGRWPQWAVSGEWPRGGLGRAATAVVAVVREEGSNGDRELAAAFSRAGFEVWDVSMKDLQTDPGAGAMLLQRFRGLAFAGGFSFADVLGSAKGWAAGVLCDPILRAAFQHFRSRSDTFSLGICNGCQLMARLGFFGNGLSLRPNRSRRFESRFPTVRVEESPALLLQGLEASTLGVWVAHGEGRFVVESGCEAVPALKYVGPDGAPTDRYPFNPNGSQQQLAAVCSRDGRHLAMMPHPERSVLVWQWPWMPTELKEKWGEETPWMHMFRNAFEFCA